MVLPTDIPGLDAMRAAGPSPAAQPQPARIGPGFTPPPPYLQTLGGGVIPSAAVNDGALSLAKRLQSRKFLLTAGYTVVLTLLGLLYLAAPSLRTAHPELHDLIYNARMLIGFFLGVEGGLDFTRAVPDITKSWRK